MTVTTGTSFLALSAFWVTGNKCLHKVLGALGKIASQAVLTTEMMLHCTLPYSVSNVAQSRSSCQIKGAAQYLVFVWFLFLSVCGVVLFVLVLFCVCLGFF